MNRLYLRLLGVIILALATIFYAFPWHAYDIEMPFSGKEYRLGLDLQGGVELDYKVDLSGLEKEEGYDSLRENAILENLKSIVDKRVETLKINDSVITTATYGTEKHIIVQIPLKGATKAENDNNIIKAKQAIGRVMRIEFKEARTEITQQDLEARSQIAQDFLKEAQESEYAFGVTTAKYHDTFEKISLGELSGTLEELSKYFTLDEEKLTPGIYPEVLSGSGVAQFGIIGGQISQTSGEGYYILNIVDIIQDDIISVEYAFVDGEPSEWKPAMDSKGRILNDQYFLNAGVQYNQAFQPMVELTFNDEGAKIFGELTKRLKGKQIAIFVGGEMLTAPNVNEPILTGKAVITGSYTPKEAQKLANDINTGVVPAPIYLTSERTIDSKLGANSLSELINAGIWGFVLIMIFLIIIYRVGGFLAGIALFIYLTIVLTLVKALGVVMTLAGIAGLVLSVGMAIDANILIFERLKDALKSGEKIEKAIEEGFDKSWSAIWDSNLTGIIVSIILFIFGVNMIKGFGLMLGIGLVISLFTAMFISRLFIRLYAQKNNLNYKTFIGLEMNNEGEKNR